MSDPLDNGYVNWVDGMKISKSHFQQVQQAAEDRFQDTRALMAEWCDHGLLPWGYMGKPALAHSLTFEGRDRFQFRLDQCRAVTAGGDRIEMLGTADRVDRPFVLNGSVPVSLMTEGAAFDIVLRVTTTLEDHFGVPDPQESPVRHPSVRPLCTLEMVPVKDLKQDVFGRHHLAIARMHVVKDELVEDEAFIPASMSMAALPRLQEFMREYTKFLKDLERNMFRIVIKLNGQRDKTELQIAVETLCKAGLRSLEHGLGTVQLLGDRMSPRMVVLHAVQLARTMHHAIELLTGRGKDGLLDYIREHTGVNPADHQLGITGLLDLVYDHADLRTSLGRVMLFCRLHKKLMDQWVGLDYIGQKQDKNIFIGQEVPVASRQPSTPRPAPGPSRPPPQPKPTTGWDF